MVPFGVRVDTEVTNGSVTFDYSWQLVRHVMKVIMFIK